MSTTPEQGAQLPQR